jgi:hypothetical protein
LTDSTPVPETINMGLGWSGVRGNGDEPRGKN